MAKHLIFIDFSSSSTAICKFNTRTKRYNYYLLLNHYAFTKSDTRNPMDSSHLSKFKDVGNSLIISFYKKKAMSRPKGSPSVFCRYMLETCYNIATTFDSLMDIALIDVDLDDVIFGIEDYPIGIKSNNQAEMIELISSCKNKLYNRGVEVKTINFYQPQAIKAMTGNGNATKLDMLNYLVKRSVSIPVNKTIVANKKSFEMAKGKVAKPVEDLVDAFCGIMLLRKEYDL